MTLDSHCDTLLAIVYVFSVFICFVCLEEATKHCVLCVTISLFTHVLHFNSNWVV